MISIVISNQFKKDLKLAKKRGLKINHLKLDRQVIVLCYHLFLVNSI